MTIEDAATVQVLGGTFFGVTIEDAATVQVLGGTSSGVGIHGAATVQVLGGTLGFISIFLSSGEADFFGTLVFSPSPSGGSLTGTLADGTPINSAVTLGTGTTVLTSPGEVRFLGPTAVPEPASLVLLGTGLLGAFGAAWPSRRRARGPGDGHR